MRTRFLVCVERVPCGTKQSETKRNETENGWGGGGKGLVMKVQKEQPVPVDAMHSCERC